MYMNNGHQQFFRNIFSPIYFHSVFTVYLHISHPLRMAVPCWAAFLVKAMGLFPRNPCKLEVLHCPCCRLQAAVSVQA